LHNLFRSTSNLQAFENFLSTLRSFFFCASMHRVLRRRPVPAPGRHGERLGAAEGVSENGEGSELKLDLAPVRREVPKFGRNEACPCGSGKKIQELLRPDGVTIL